jgi:hypothetical protein
LTCNLAAVDERGLDLGSQRRPFVPGTAATARCVEAQAADVERAAQHGEVLRSATAPVRATAANATQRFGFISEP